MIDIPSAADVLRLVEYYFSIWGLVVLPIAAFLENSVIFGFIFPGMTVILLSGFAARTTEHSLVFIITLATLGSFAGDNFDYFVGHHTGRLVVKKPLFAKPVAKVTPYLEKYGILAIFLGRFTAWTRAWVALVCGITGVNYFKFATVSFISATVWSSIWITAGYLLAGQRQLIEDWLGRASLISYAIFVGLLVYFIRGRFRLVSDLVKFVYKKSKKKLGYGGELEP